MKRFLKLESRDIVVVVSLAMFMIQLDSAVLTIALPVIARDFEVPVVSLSLSITIYLTMLVAVLPVSGWAADRFGARRVFLAATAVFALFSLCCALAPGFWTFILARAFQGASASLLAPVGRLIMLQRTSKEELLDALSITAMPMLIAPTVGPSIGGFIVDYGRWEYIFLLNIPFAAILFFLTKRNIADMEPNPSRKLDWVGLLLLSFALIASLMGFDRLTGGIARPLPWTLIAFGLALGWLTWRHIKRHRQPIIALDAFKYRNFRTNSIGAGAIIRLPARAMLFALPLMLQVGFGYSPFVAGIMLMALNGGDLITKPWVKPVFDRFGVRNTIMVGSAMGLAGLTAIAVVERGPYTLAIILAALLLCGISRSLIFTGLSFLTFADLQEDTVVSGNVVANISMQLFNAIAVSATALVLGLATQMSGIAEPQIGEFRFTIGVMIAVGVIASIMLWRHLPLRRPTD